MSNTKYGIDLDRLAQLMKREAETFAQKHPQSKELFDRAQDSYLYGTPLHWMSLWPGPHPLYVESAQGARLRDVDGQEFIDLCLGDTGAMFGHAQPQVTQAIQKQLEHGTTTMLPSADAIWVGEELGRRFGLKYWGMTTSATDANRTCIRLARMATKRDKVLCFSHCYHGAVDETHVERATTGDKEMRLKSGVHRNGLDYNKITVCIEFNDILALEEALSAGDIACVITEPVMTNIGMVPALPGFHDALRKLTKKFGTLLIIDETHTISTGPGGYTKIYGLEPDMFVLGKSIGGGIPCGVYGVSEEAAQVIWSALPRQRVSTEMNHFGFGGTLAGSSITLAAMKATFQYAMTEDNYQHMIRLAKRLEEGVKETLEQTKLPWHVTRIGARIEYLFRQETPKNGGEADEARFFPLESYIHLFMLNRGVLLTPFHNMALVCPALTDEDVDKHNDIFRECATELCSQ
jgi:glutamate-1-semialdehyde 2,1-aminomutase